ncbi:MAG TPA: hypothetical protein VMJ32_16740 [Pirellulales bacterium]|nr:hypothetical protein [Pirellulales bacterium]
MSDHQNQNDEISKAVMALQELPVPEGPSPETVSRTLAALRAAADRPQSIPLFCPINTLRWAVQATALLGIAAAVLVMCLVFSNLGGGSVAFAQVAQKLHDAFTLSYDSTITSPGEQEPKLKYRTWYMEPGKARMDMGDTITIMNHATGANLVLNNKLKTAIVTPANSTTNSAVGDLPNLIDMLRSLVGKSSHPLGEKEMDGQKAKGFVCDVKSDLQYTIWVNAATGDPIRAEFPLNIGPVQGTVAMTNFKLDQPLDPALFSVDVPEGYKTVELPALDKKILQITPTENIVEILRVYAEKSDGEFPKRLDNWGDFATKFTKGMDQEHPNADEMKKVMVFMQRVGVFAGSYLFSHKKGTDYDYLPGSKLGEQDRIVFWIRDDKNGDYKAVYGDLRIEKINKEQLPPPATIEAPETKKIPRNPSVNATKSQ